MVDGFDSWHQALIKEQNICIMFKQSIFCFLLVLIASGWSQQSPLSSSVLSVEQDAVQQF